MGSTYLAVRWIEGSGGGRLLDKSDVFVALGGAPACQSNFNSKKRKSCLLEPLIKWMIMIRSSTLSNACGLMKISNIMVYGLHVQQTPNPPAQEPSSFPPALTHSWLKIQKEP